MVAEARARKIFPISLELAKKKTESPLFDFLFCPLRGKRCRTARGWRRRVSILVVLVSIREPLLRPELETHEVATSVLVFEGAAFNGPSEFLL
jgi:hypothetical protein